MFYKKAFKLTVVFLFASVVALSQKTDPCELRLTQAEELYRIGRYQDIPAYLEDCPYLKSLDKTTQQRASELLAKSYLDAEKNQKAEELFVHILKINPNYPNEPNEPELVHYTKQYKSWRLLVGSSMGNQLAPVSFGGNYNLERVNKSSQSTTIRGKAFLTAWVGFDFFESDNLEVIAEFKNTPTRYKYSSNLEVTLPDQTTGTAQINFDEVSKWLEWNLLINYHFPIEKLSYGGRFKYYAQLGGGYNLMRESRLENIALSPNWDTEKTSLDALVISRGVESLRVKNNYSILTGIGMNYRVSNHIALYGQVRYNLKLRNIVDTSNRFNNSTLTDDFYYVDDDKFLHGISFSAGIYYTRFYRWRKK